MKSRHRPPRLRPQIARPGDPAAAASRAGFATSTPPLALSVYLISRNLVPVIGVLFLGWSAAQQLILYLVDTLLAMGVVIALLFQTLFPIETEDDPAARINAAGGVLGYSAFLVAVIAIPLGVPLIFVLGPGGLSLSELLTQKFLFAAAAHVAFALLTLIAMFRELRGIEQPGPALRRQFGWILMRWAVVVVIIYTGIPALFGRFGGLVVVIAYAAFGIAADLAPRTVARILRVSDAAK